MNFMKRAVLYVTRKRGKSILLFFVLLIMATFVLTGLSIKKAAQINQRNLREALGGRFTVAPDYSPDNPYAKFDVDTEGNTSIHTERPVTKDVIDAVMRIDGIKGYDAAAQTLVDTDLDLLPGNVPVKSEYKDRATARITETTKRSSYFTSNILALAEGRHIMEDDKGTALISSNLAKRNNLKIGDRISLHSEGQADVEIIGIFDILKPDSPYANLTSFEKLENQFFIDFNLFEQLIPGLPVGFQTVTFEVDDPEQLDAVISQVKGLTSIDWIAFTVEPENQAYKETAAPLSALRSLMSVVLAVIVVVGVIILSLILTMWTRGRIHETGVLLSLGIRKRAILGQFLTEVLFIAVFAFAASYFTSNVVAGGIGNALLQQNEQDIQAPSDDGITVRGGSDGMITRQKDAGGNAAEQKADKTASHEDKTAANKDGTASVMEGAVSETMDITVGPDNMLQLYLIGSAVIILSVIVSSVTVMRLKPGEILTKMS